MAESLVGKVLSNRYEIIEKIGEGGMASVYKARCRMLQRFVAIKVLKDEYKVDEEIVKKFNRESQAAGSLSHPNIVSVYDVGYDNGINYIVMELVEGMTLKDYISKYPLMNWRMALSFGMQICSALAHAHKNGIIHRDIKPHNIIINKDGNCKVTDFGIACVANSNETKKIDEGILGSVHYISPELAKGMIPDERSDIYSLGVTMYEMLTDQLPFDGENAVSIAVKHINTEPKSIKDINIVVPLRLCKIVEKAMAKDINMRYQSADELYKDLYNLSNDPEIYSSGTDLSDIKPDFSETRMINKDDVKQIRENIKDKSDEIEIPIKSSNAATSENRRKKKVKLKDKLKNLFKADNKQDKIAVVAAVLVSIIIISSVTVIGVEMVWPGTISNLFTRKNNEFVIPDLKGEDLDDVKEKYKDYDIEYVIDEEVENDEYEAGQIVSHEPLAGMNVKLPIKLHLVISKGTKEIKLSRYIDKEYRQAESAIKNLGLKCEKEEEFSEDVPEGYVISQDPLPDTEVKAGSVVVLTVSKGADFTLVKVPQLIGKTEAEAKAAISDANLILGGIIRQDSSKPEGTVISQSVPAGSELEKKSKITITISNGKSAPEETTPDGEAISKAYTLTLELPLTKETVHVLVKKDGVTAYDKTVSTSMKTLSITLKGSGQSVVEVYYDNTLMKTQKITF